MSALWAHEIMSVEYRLTAFPPKEVRISLEFLRGADPIAVRISGDRITFRGDNRSAMYRASGWDSKAGSLIAELVE